MKPPARLRCTVPMACRIRCSKSSMARCSSWRSSTTSATPSAALMSQICTTNNSYFQWNAIAALAAAADTLKGWDDALAKDCLETAIKAWKDTTANPTLYPTSSGPEGETPANGVLAASQGVVSGEQGARKPKSILGAATNSAAPAVPPTGFGRGRPFVGMDWAAALELTIATNG